MHAVDLKYAYRLLNHGPTMRVGNLHPVAGGHFYAIDEPVAALPVAKA